MTTVPDFGRCPCGGRFETKVVDISIAAPTGPVRLSDVPQGHCPNCQSRVYRPEMLAHIENVYRMSRRSFGEESAR
jgi:hypothetical protein